MSMPFRVLEKQAGPGMGLLRKGIRSAWDKGAWKTLQSATNLGANRSGVVGQLSRFARPVADTMTGTVGKGLGAYGLAGLTSPLTGVDLPGSDLALNLSMPIFGSMNTAANLISAGRTNSTQGRSSMMADVKTGANQAAQDFISGLHINPNVASDADAYREFSGQIGRGMKGADTYNNGGYKDMTGWRAAQNLFGNPDALIKNKLQMQIQQYLPQLMKNAGVGKMLGAGMKGLMVGGATLGLGNAIFGKKPYDEAAVQGEGYSAAQAAIQKRLQGMSSIERMAARWDPTLVGNAIAEKFPDVMKSWESKYGPYQRSALSKVVNNFNTGKGTRYYSTDAGGNNNFIN